VQYTAVVESKAHGRGIHVFVSGLLSGNSIVGQRRKPIAATRREPIHGGSAPASMRATVAATGLRLFLQIHQVIPAKKDI
jgi:hypothetical protein